ncbi:hypothetical protein U5801_27165 [Lamprobacter modestohalophilus]|uniref:hypothetical protein n=1 Tax=Lamprobacter modestohalophilus TaxID=1064514 RepID=UPI002ADEAAC2|nr:hypothetical protein [Lamprobacter modestohalophilus]MEA1053455.1 hypothetical protein [Lamprobacter modestohalophilus]
MSNFVQALANAAGAAMTAMIVIASIIGQQMDGFSFRIVFSYIDWNLTLGKAVMLL